MNRSVDLSANESLAGSEEDKDTIHLQGSPIIEDER